MTTITLTMTQTKELYNELIAKTESQFKKIGISDAYINEFIMIISICASNDMNIVYPFYELSKIANHVLNTNLKTSIGIILQKHLSNKTPIELLHILKIEKKFNKDTQDFIISKMKYIFNYETICCKIELCDIKLIMNKKIVDIIKIMNDVDIHVLLNLFCKKNNLIENNVKLLIDNMEMNLNEKLIDYGISYENNIINVIILQKS
jgi:hypothetical protein